MAARDPSIRPIGLTHQSFQDPRGKDLPDGPKRLFWKTGFVSTPIGKAVFVTMFIVMVVTALEAIFMAGSEFGFFLGESTVFVLNFMLIYNGWAIVIIAVIAVYSLIWKVEFMGETYYCTGPGQVGGDLWYNKTLTGTRLIAAAWVRVRDPKMVPGQKGSPYTRAPSFVQAGFRKVRILYYGRPDWGDPYGKPDRRLFLETMKAQVWTMYHREQQYNQLAAELSVANRVIISQQQAQGISPQEMLVGSRQVAQSG